MDQSEYIQQLEMENTALKKEIIKLWEHIEKLIKQVQR